MEVLMRRILVATDGSGGAHRAVDAAADLAGKLKLELWILSAMDGVSDEVLELSRKERIALGDAIGAVANGTLAAAKERAQKRRAEKLHIRGAPEVTAAGRTSRHHDRVLRRVADAI
jgi:nucleotide-binding universal stress UspA family protein